MIDCDYWCDTYDDDDIRLDDDEQDRHHNHHDCIDLKLFDLWNYNDHDDDNNEIMMIIMIMFLEQNELLSWMNKM